MNIKKIPTHIRGIILKKIRKKQKTLDAEEIIAEIIEIILKAINNESPDRKVSGRIRIQMAVIPKEGLKWSGAPEEKNACYALGLTTQESLVMREIESSTNTDSFNTHCGVPIISRSSFISMMQSWVNQCLGSEFSYQVSLSDEQYLKIIDEFHESYEFLPEQSAVSPRGGAIVKELVYPKFKVLLYIICLTELGPRSDLIIASEAMNKMTAEVRRTLMSKYRPETISTYPNIKSALSAK